MKSGMTMKEWLPLLGMTFTAFIFNTSEFIPIGLLTDIAKAFQLSEATAGLLISVYAWVVMLLSLPLMLLASKADYRKLLLGTIFVFSVCQVLSTASGSYAMLMLSRIGVACTHAIFWSIASPLAVRIVSEAHRPFALSMIATGTSVAMVAGLPLGRVIGLLLGWRMAFGMIAVCGFAALLFQGIVFPKVEKPDTFSLAELPGLFKNPALVSIYVLTLVLITAHYTGYGYIEPFLSQAAGLSDGAVTGTLTLFGGIGIIGSILYARFYEKNPQRFIGFIAAGMTACLLLMGFAAGHGAAVILLCAVWGVAATAFNVTFQGETIYCTKESEGPVAMSIYSGIYNFGIGCGTFLGGQVTTRAGIGAIGYVGGMLAIAACVYCFLVLLRRVRN
ncbi:MAG: sugar transporter [Eubacteriales bacterium]|nr:sugar transporter [Eubacteriales bacterium]